ncbi:MAG TPA: TlpA disulfide reductase family protein [Candidatus Acidoferrum sp.]|jgi:cytochrome c biogenesis protein CcmG, thiol:disulfide interchange protein DsbE|nr:TlpA disulfide reductase family protein [Candidatus Acidoferrum sp.]
MAMPLVRRIAGWAAVALAAGILVLFAMPSYRQGEASIAGKSAQDFPLTLAGKSERLSDLKGKVVVLNFWATWCPPCVEETPSLNRLEKYIDSRGGMVLGVSIDEDGAAYEQFLRDHSVVFPTYRDATKKTASDYGTSIFPETYIIDRRGKIARKFVGEQQWDSAEMLAYFDAVLGQS